METVFTLTGSHTKQLAVRRIFHWTTFAVAATVSTQIILSRLRTPKIFCGGKARLPRISGNRPAPHAEVITRPIATGSGTVRRAVTDAELLTAKSPELAILGTRPIALKAMNTRKKTHTRT